MTRRSGNGIPPDDDHDLWRVVTESVHPLRRRDRTIAAGTTSPPAPTQSPAIPTAAVPASSPGVPDPRRWQPLVTTPHPKPPAPKPTEHFDRRQAKRIARGHVAIEGRLDLHGLTEHDAHHRLRAFLRQAQAQDKRIVLVITGKGRDTDDGTTPYDFGMGGSRRGVLKRNVPRWLTEPDLAGIVVSFGAAHIRHGGEGALYVHLRQRRG